jgi:hypothetical protein
LLLLAAPQGAAAALLLPQRQALQHQLYAPDLPHQLQLAFNMSAPQPADALMKQLLQSRKQPAQLQLCLSQLDQQRARLLLSTARLRRHFDAAESFEDLLHTWDPEWSFVAEVSAAITSAVQQRDSAAVARLCKLQAAQQLQPTVVADLLLQVMQHDDNVAVAHLTELPAAGQLPVGSAAPLLQEAQKQGFTEVVAFVCQQHAAEVLDAAAIMMVMRCSGNHRAAADSGAGGAA